MSDLKQFREKLERSLQGVLDRPVVSASEEDRYKVLFSVISPTFEGMDEGNRQEIVWDQVLNNFDEGEQDRIEFIYTEAPSELEPEAKSG